jgi:hypothetical protein
MAWCLINTRDNFTFVVEKFLFHPFNIQAYKMLLVTSVFYFPSRWLCSSDLVKKDDRIIDLGCGNGMLLVELVIMVDKLKKYELNCLYIC